MIKAKIKINIKRTRQMRFRNLKTTKDLGVLIDAKFKAKNKEMLNLYLEISILTIVSHAFSLFNNDFLCEV